MITRIPGVACTIVAVLLAAACATPPPLPPAEQLKNVAIVTAGNVVSFSYTTSTDHIVAMVEVDGKAVDKPYGPVALQPGAHSILMRCADATKLSNVTVKAGEIYQFNRSTTPGVKGCVGTLSRIR